MPSSFWERQKLETGTNFCSWEQAVKRKTRGPSSHFQRGGLKFGRHHEARVGGGCVSEASVELNNRRTLFPDVVVIN